VYSELTAPYVIDAGLIVYYSVITIKTKPLASVSARSEILNRLSNPPQPTALFSVEDVVVAEADWLAPTSKSSISIQLLNCASSDSPGTPSIFRNASIALPCPCCEWSVDAAKEL
jgi:hypothetical protein